MNIWITGASSGIGLALAQHYAALGTACCCPRGTKRRWPRRSRA